MNAPPPPRPRPKRCSPWFSALIGLLAFGAALVLIVGGIFTVQRYLAPGATRALDNKFGDQFLKTAVALIELHKVRYGKFRNRQVASSTFALGSTFSFLNQWLANFRFRTS